MSRITRITALAMAALLAAAPLAGQDRTFVVQALGGGFGHIANLNDAGTAHWKAGFNLGAAVGVNMTKYVGLHGDFTYATNQALGTASFAGKDFDRFYYGGHIELRYPTESGIAPFMFGGAGAVTVHERGATPILPSFTRLAGMFGAGLSYTIPDSKVDLLLEAKGLTYKWDMAEFNKNTFDLTYSIGFAYRFGK